MIQIVPSILSADFAHLADEIARVEKGGAGMLHVDVMDGHFVPNLTLGPPLVESVRKVTKLVLDVHLMVSNPDFFAPIFINAGGGSGICSLRSGDAPRPYDSQHPKPWGAGWGGAQSRHACQRARRHFAGSGLRSDHERKPRIRRAEVHPERAEQDPAAGPDSAGKTVGLFAIEIDGGVNLDNVEKIVEV